MTKKLYRSSFAALLVVLIGMPAGPAGSAEPTAKDATLETDQSLRVVTDCESFDEVYMSIQNRGEGPCRCTVEAFRNGDKIPDEEFASFAGSSFEVGKNIKKIVGFDCIMDEFVVHMVEGKADIRVTQVSFE